MKITIDAREIEAKEGQTILEAAQENRIYIPHLCKHPDLEAAGGCRLCVVEIEGVEGAIPSCETPVKDGMTVYTNTEAVQKIRKTSMELMLASHPTECTDCPKYGNCELQSLYQFFNASPENWRMKGRNMPGNTENPLIRHQFVRCIRCGRCVRACGALRGVKVLDYRKRKSDVWIGTEDRALLADAGCRFCGACAEVCPTGAITDALEAVNPELPREKALVPCRSACPAGVDIPAFLRSIAKRDWGEAAAVIRESVPIPMILGSICEHPCESECRRGSVNEPVSICRLKRIAAEIAEKQGGSWRQKRKTGPKTGRRAAIVGSGPAGLTAAYYLAVKGHEVTIFEAAEKAGGQLRMGIPAYRLADEMLDAEIQTILETGIDLRCNTAVRQPADLLQDGFDAVFVAVGTHKGKRLPIKGNDLPGVWINTDFLKAARSREDVEAGTHVVVLGGGNVAIDCARTALRLGASDVTIACLEAKNCMTASKEEIREAKEEGIQFENEVTFLAIEGEQAVTGVRVQKIQDFYFDENRRAVIVPQEGTEHILQADHVIFAVGQEPDGTEEMDLALCHGNYLAVDESGATDRKGVYAAGDVVTGTRSVIEAVARGKACASAIDRYMGGDGDICEHFRNGGQAESYIGRVENFAFLKRMEADLRPGAERCHDFGQIECLDEDKAVCEAGRCLQCDLRLQLGRNRFWNEYMDESEG